MTVKDPVCSMEFESDTADASRNYEGATYYFCCKGCQNQFRKNPQEYIEGNAGGGGNHAHHH